MIKSVQFSPEQLEKFSKYEVSISHWSVEHTALVSKAKSVLEQVESLYSGRQKFLNEFLSANDISPGSVLSVNVSPSGEVAVIIRDPSIPDASMPAADVPMNGAPSNGVS